MKESNQSPLLIAWNPSPCAILSPSSPSALFNIFSTLSAIYCLTPLIAATKLQIVFFFICSSITLLNNKPGCIKSLSGLPGRTFATKPVTT